MITPRLVRLLERLVRLSFRQIRLGIPDVARKQGIFLPQHVVCILPSRDMFFKESDRISPDYLELGLCPAQKPRAALGRKAIVE